MNNELEDNFDSLDEVDELEEEIEKLKTVIREKRKTLRQLKPQKKRGRKAGQNGMKCKKIRYHVERVVEKLEDDGETQKTRNEIIGDFSTLQEIADLLKLSYSQVQRTFKQQTKLADTLIITRLL